MVKKVSAAKLTKTAQRQNHLSLSVIVYLLATNIVTTIIAIIGKQDQLLGGIELQKIMNERRRKIRQMAQVEDCYNSRHREAPRRKASIDCSLDSIEQKYSKAVIDYQS